MMNMLGALTTVGAFAFVGTLALLVIEDHIIAWWKKRKS